MVRGGPEAREGERRGGSRGGGCGPGGRGSGVGATGGAPGPVSPARGGGAGGRVIRWGGAGGGGRGRARGVGKGGRGGPIEEDGGGGCVSAPSTGRRARERRSSLLRLYADMAIVVAQALHMRRAQGGDGGARAGGGGLDIHGLRYGSLPAGGSGLFSGLECG